MSTRLVIRTFVRDCLQEPSAKHWTDPMLNALIDDAVEEVYGKIAFNVEGDWYTQEADADTNIVSGTKRYAWPTIATPARKMIRFDRVERVGADTPDPYDLGEVTKDERHYYTSAGVWYGVPKFYHEPPYIVLLPTPTTSVTGGLRFHGVWEHGPLASDSAEPIFPSRYHRLVGYYAAMMALGLDESSPVWIAQNYVKGVSKMLGELPLHTVTESRDLGA